MQPSDRGIVKNVSGAHNLNAARANILATLLPVLESPKSSRPYDILLINYLKESVNNAQTPKELDQIVVFVDKTREEFRKVRQLIEHTRSLYDQKETLDLPTLETEVRGIEALIETLRKSSNNPLMGADEAKPIKNQLESLEQSLTTILEPLEKVRDLHEVVNLYRLAINLSERQVQDAYKKIENAPALTVAALSPITSELISDINHIESQISSIKKEFATEIDTSPMIQEKLKVVDSSLNKLTTDRERLQAAPSRLEALNTLSQTHEKLRNLSKSLDQFLQECRSHWFHRFLNRIDKVLKSDFSGEKKTAKSQQAVLSALNTTQGALEEIGKSSRKEVGSHVLAAAEEHKGQVDKIAEKVGKSLKKKHEPKKPKEPKAKATRRM